MCPFPPRTRTRFPGRPPLLDTQYWVPRIQLLFCAEDPRVFTQRVVQANALRKNTEALLLYNLYVDCMPTEGQRVINEQSLSKIKQWALSTPRMHKGPRCVMCCSDPGPLFVGGVAREIAETSL